MENTLEILHALDEREDIRNIAIINYESLERKQHDFQQCWFLKQNFHVIFIVSERQKSSFKIPKDFNQQICTTLHFSSSQQKTCRISDHIITQIINFIVQKIKPCVRRAYYCLSLDRDFPEAEKIMDIVGREHVYCSIIKSFSDFLQLNNHFTWDISDPCKMNVLPILINNVRREIDTNEKSGKLMFFLEGKWFFKWSVKALWKQLRQFGDEHQLHVSVTTAFPSVEYKVIYIFAQ